MNSIGGLKGLFNGVLPTPRTSVSAVSLPQSVDTAILCQDHPFSHASKFEGLQGFIVQQPGAEVKLAFTTGQAVTYPRVGRLYYINHPQDQEINHRVVVIFRTNNDSWSCYGFCKYADKEDCENPEFKEEHAEIVATRRPQGPHVDVPGIELDVRDRDGKTLELDPDLWINCRKTVDIKHTVRLAPLGSVEKESLRDLLHKGLHIFINTFGDLDRDTLRSIIESRGATPLLTPSPPSVLGNSPGRRSERRPKGLKVASNNIWDFHSK